MKRVIAFLSILAAMVFGMALISYWINEPRREFARFQQVQIGMTEAEAKEIMGGTRVGFGLMGERVHVLKAVVSPSIRKQYRFYINLDKDAVVVGKYAEVDGRPVQCEY